MFININKRKARRGGGGGDFHARLRFTHSTIPAGKWGLLVVSTPDNSNLQGKSKTVRVRVQCKLSGARRKWPGVRERTVFNAQ